MCPTEGAKISQVQSTDGQKNRVYMNEAATRITELKTALHSFHVEHGGKMVPFAGYQMPVQYPEGACGCGGERLNKISITLRVSR